jgi:hypothetical protein
MFRPWPGMPLNSGRVAREEHNAFGASPLEMAMRKIFFVRDHKFSQLPGT